MRRLFCIPVTPSAQPTGQWFFPSAIAISLLLHAVVGVALIDGADRQLPETEETPILVELVPPPEPEAPEPSPQPEDQPKSEEQLAELPPILPVLQPVIEFGETDRGPRIDPDGELEHEPNEPEPDEPEQPGQVADDEAAPDDFGTVGPIATLVTPTPKPVRNPATAAREERGKAGAMTSATQLFSDALLDDPRVRTAIAGMPRSERANLLCMTEMRGQLRAARPPRPPEILPSFRLPTGTVLEPRQAAFRSQGKWFDLAFRCEVDEGVTKVQKFSYRIGDAIPRAEWSQRGFPSF